jgi:hypothetical protein
MINTGQRLDQYTLVEITKKTLRQYIVQLDKSLLILVIFITLVKSIWKINWFNLERGAKLPIASESVISGLEVPISWGYF